MTGYLLVKLHLAIQQHLFLIVIRPVQPLDLLHLRCLHVYNLKVEIFDLASDGWTDHSLLGQGSFLFVVGRSHSSTLPDRAQAVVFI